MFGFGPELEMMDDESRVMNGETSGTKLKVYSSVLLTTNDKLSVSRGTIRRPSGGRNPDNVFICRFKSSSDAQRISARGSDP